MLFMEEEEKAIYLAPPPPLGQGGGGVRGGATVISISSSRRRRGPFFWRVGKNEESTFHRSSREYGRKRISIPKMQCYVTFLYKRKTGKVKFYFSML